MSFANKVTIITGANSGIGRDCAIKFIESGATVAAVDIRTDRIEELKTVAERHGTLFMSYVCDVRNEGAVAEVVKNVAESCGGEIDILLNVAGVSTDKSITRTSYNEFARVMGINVGGTFNFCKYTVPYMKKQNCGVIINTSSVTAKYGSSMGAPYPASKAAVIGFTKSLAMELAGWNIRVNSVAPGVIDTEMVAALNEYEKTIVANSIPLGRIGTPSDVAEAMMFLASEKASYITGSTLDVAGGYLSASITYRPQG